MTHLTKVANVLRNANEAMYGPDIETASGVHLMLYPTLQVLENDGVVESWFEDGPWPRRRVYRWVGVGK